MSEYEYADYVISEIISSLDENDNERLKSLFSNSVTETVDDLDTQCDIFSDFIGSKIVFKGHNGKLHYAKFIY